MTELANLVLTSIEDAKGQDVTCLDVSQLTDVTDTMILVSGTSSRHVKSIANNAVVDLKKAGHPPIGMEGTDDGEWVLVDFGDVVLHVMQPQTREFYDLEGLWSNANLPARSQSEE